MKWYCAVVLLAAGPGVQAADFGYMSAKDIQARSMPVRAVAGRPVAGPQDPKSADLARDIADSYLLVLDTLDMSTSLFILSNYEAKTKTYNPTDREQIEQALKKASEQLQKAPRDKNPEDAAARVERARSFAGTASTLLTAEAWEHNDELLRRRAAGRVE